jgi:thiosulfate reductase cytochrome b subunit
MRSAQPLHVRIAHWTNVVAFTILAWSGFSMFVTERSFRPIVHRVPSAVWSALHVAGHRDLGRAWHMGLAIVFLANIAGYSVMSIATGSWRRIVPRGAWLRDAWTSGVDELIAPRRTLEHAEYTAAQRLAYSLVMVAGTVIIVSGVALWAKHVVPLLPLLFRTEYVAHGVHVVAALGVIAFIVVHVVQVYRAGVPTLLGMLTGTTTPAPVQRRRSLALAAGGLIAVVLVFTVANVTSGPTRIPVFLRWAVGPPRPSHRHERAPAAMAAVKPG